MVLLFVMEEIEVATGKYLRIKYSTNSTDNGLYLLLEFKSVK